MSGATWNRVLEELARLQLEDTRNPPAPGQPARGDMYRRSKIGAVETVTGRPLILYASACTSPGKPVSSEMLMLDFGDKIGFKTVTDRIDRPHLDVLVHSPGGYPEAVESMVQQLRRRFTSLRFIVPSFAKSAATMLAMAGDEILMDPDAELGPIDPQMRTQNGTSPAEAILEQFEKAQQELQNAPGRLPGWMPILAQLGPSLLVDSKHAIELASSLVKTWTMNYMFRGDAEADGKSTAVAGFLSDHARFKSHARAVKLPDLRKLGVKATDISATPALYQAVDEVYCCLDVLFANSAVYKLFENSAGDALIRQSGVLQAQIVRPLPAE